MKIDDKIGQYGQLLHAILTGIGQSSGGYNTASTIIQTNNMISGSDFKELNAVIEPDLTRSRVEPSKSEPKSFNILQRKGRVSVPSCDKIVQSVFDRMDHPSILSRTLSKDPKVSSENPLSQLNKDSNMDDGKNFTLVDTKINIGPSGYTNDIIDMASGEASNSGNGQYLDFQSHGTFKYSDIDLAQVSLQL